MLTTNQEIHLQYKFRRAYLTGKSEYATALARRQHKCKGLGVLWNLITAGCGRRSSSAGFRGSMGGSGWGGGQGKGAWWGEGGVGWAHLVHGGDGSVEGGLVLHGITPMSASRKLAPCRDDGRPPCCQGGQQTCKPQHTQGCATISLSFSMMMLGSAAGGALYRF